MPLYRGPKPPTLSDQTHLRWTSRKTPEIFPALISATRFLSFEHRTRQKPNLREASCWLTDWRHVNRYRSLPRRHKDFRWQSFLYYQLISRRRYNGLKEPPESNLWKCPGPKGDKTCKYWEICF